MVTNEVTMRSICGFCQAHCGIIISVADGELRRVKGDPDNPTGGGYICSKGAAAWDTIYSEDRLLYPLKRTEAGFQRVSWDEALNIAATRLTEIKQQYGGETLIRCSGAPVTETARDGFGQFLAAFGSNNHVGSSHLCHVPRKIAFSTIYGEMTQPDYRNTRCMLVWGANPAESHRLGEDGAAYGDIIHVIRETKARGAKLIVIDPKRIDLVDIADKWLPVEPGRDDALALAMINVIIAEGLYDKEFVNRWTLGFEKLADHVKRFTPDWGQDITGIPAEDISEVARMYANARPALIREGNFTDQYPNAVQTARAIGVLEAITGNLDTEGGNVFFPQPALTPLTNSKMLPKRMSADKYPLFPRVPFPFFVDAVLTGRPFLPRAMIVHHANPVLINADSGKTTRALQKLDFLLVCDIFMTATANLADLILPESTEFEQYGFGAHASAAGGFVALRQKVIEPVGESRPVFEIEYELAKRMGIEVSYPWQNVEGWLNHRLKASGVTLERLKKQPIIFTTPPLKYRKYLDENFNTASGKVELDSPILKDHGYQPLPEPKEPHEVNTRTDEYPLLGTTRRPGTYTHTRFRNVKSLLNREPHPLMRISPEDARSRGIEDKDVTIVKSPSGTIEIMAKVIDEVRPGVVVIDFGWGNPWDNGANVNYLTSDLDRDPISGTTSNRRFRCQVTRIES